MRLRDCFLEKVIGWLINSIRFSSSKTALNLDFILENTKISKVLLKIIKYKENIRKN